MPVPAARASAFRPVHPDTTEVKESRRGRFSPVTPYASELKKDNQGPAPLVDYDSDREGGISPSPTYAFTEDLAAFITEASTKANWYSTVLVDVAVPKTVKYHSQKEHVDLLKRFLDEIEPILSRGIELKAARERAGAWVGSEVLEESIKNLQNCKKKIEEAIAKISDVKEPKPADQPKTSEEKPKEVKETFASRVRSYFSSFFGWVYNRLSSMSSWFFSFFKG